MATIKQGILGAFSGKVGGVVGSSWKGIAVMKAKPASVANPRTAKQIAQRGAMSGAVAFAQSILSDIIKPGFDRFVSRQSGFNAFVSENIANFDEDGVLDPSLLQITKSSNAGIEFSIEFLGIKENGNLEVEIEYVSNAGSGLNLASDIVFCIVINRSNPQAGSPITIGAKEAAGGVLRNFDVSSPFPFAVGDVIDIVLASRRSDGTVVFRSTHASLAIPAV